MQLFANGLASQGLNNLLNTGEQKYWLNGLAQPTLFVANTRTASAGMVLGGESSVILSFAYDITAGIVLGGNASALVSYSFDISAGIVLGGSTIRETATLRHCCGQRIDRLTYIERAKSRRRAANV